MHRTNGSSSSVETTPEKEKEGSRQSLFTPSLVASPLAPSPRFSYEEKRVLGKDAFAQTEISGADLQAALAAFSKGADKHAEVAPASAYQVAPAPLTERSGFHTISGHEDDVPLDRGSLFCTPVPD